MDLGRRSFVIPGRADGASPESITTIGAELTRTVFMDSGLAALAAIRNDDQPNPSRVSRTMARSSAERNSERSRGANADNIPPEQLQNTENIIILPTLLHEAVSDEYLKPAPDGSTMTLYEWLQTQPYDVQYRIGLDILRDLHILK